MGIIGLNYYMGSGLTTTKAQIKAHNVHHLRPKTLETLLSFFFFRSRSRARARLQWRWQRSYSTRRLSVPRRSNPRASISSLSLFAALSKNSSEVVRFLPITSFSSFFVGLIVCLEWVSERELAHMNRKVLLLSQSFNLIKETNLQLAASASRELVDDPMKSLDDRSGRWKIKSSYGDIGFKYQEDETVAYVASRMPAVYSACHRVLKEVLKLLLLFWYKD